ncbi:MAG: hypothetical protein UY48_C0006G0038 [Candidatus Gottesmanbacteria bacterium GW2011_GWB1_49_7]|uniref:Uncharacterized protein n=1 Tax=Candidatus Gottesmanbacteria bacterium GW2011_GWB1_49_7 TaxID=1618448 RepID=A0A0G1W315_9BACT|nr:MAG: hypothetical protein UY48_C0006G0038 [Candidatus Gottesmanbacteria bacterium GW2011_GWB1_49_7]
MVRENTPELEPANYVWIYTVEFWRQGDRDIYEYGPFASLSEAETVFPMFKDRMGGYQGRIAPTAVPKPVALEKLKHPYLHHGETQAKAVLLLGW